MKSYNYYYFYYFFNKANNRVNSGDSIHTNVVRIKAIRVIFLNTFSYLLDSNIKKIILITYLCIIFTLG